MSEPLQFAHQKWIRAEDAVLYLFPRALSYLNVGRRAVRLLFFGFSSASKTIQPHILQRKMTTIVVDPHLASLITDYLTNRRQFKLGMCVICGH